MSKNLNPDKALIFRVTHRGNVSWILDNGLVSRNSGVADPNFVAIGNPELIDKRRSRDVPIPPGGTLMNAHDGRVDHLDVTVMSFDDGIHNPIPDTGFAPLIEAVVAGRVRAVPFRQGTPPHAGTQNPEDTFQPPLVGNRRNTVLLVWKKRFDN